MAPDCSLIHIPNGFTLAHADQGTSEGRADRDTVGTG